MAFAATVWSALAKSVGQLAFLRLASVCSQPHTAHNVRFLHLAFDQVRIVQSPIDELDLRIVFRNLGAFVTISDQTGHVPVRMCGADGI